MSTRITDTKAETPVEETAPKKFPKKKFRQGKGSQKSHSDAFREKVGRQVMKENDERLDKVLFSNLNVVAARLKTFETEPQPLTTTVTQTTRGLGFSSAKISDWIQLVKPTLQYDRFSLYRVSLAYHRRVMMKAFPDKSIWRPGSPFVDLTTEPFVGFTQVVESHPDSFSLLAATLSSFGKTSMNKEDFCGICPQQSLRYPTGVLVDDDEGSEASTSRGRRKKPRKEDRPVEETRVSALNPYTVHLSNLRSVVEQLSDPGVPEYLRRNFIRRNPIPGADFENFVLLNPDQIMPRTYNQNTLARDFRQVNMVRDVMMKNHAHLFASINLSGKCSVSTLAVTHIKASVVDQWQVFIENQAYGSVRPLPSTQQILGIIGLTGEIPDEEYSPSLEVYGFRRYQSSVQTFDADWEQLADSLLSRP